jgi:hypothetical protein
MKTWKLVLYAVGALVFLAAATVVLRTVLWAISLAVTMIQIAAVLAIVGGIGYVGYKLYSLVSGGSSTSEPTSSTDEFSMSDIGRSTSTSTRSSGDDLRQQYLNGEITEEEFERRLERELDGGEFDDIDRELQRERI